jgi:hypothetical protein
MSSVYKHVKSYCPFCSLVEQMLSGWLVVTHREILRMRVYRIPCSDFLVACGQYVFVMRGKVTATTFTATDDVSALGAQDNCSRVRRLRSSTKTGYFHTPACFIS